MATFDQWLDLFSDAYDSVPGPLVMPCPNCGHRCLRLVFTGNPDQMVGYAHFWCDHCLEGIGTSRTIIPDDAVMRDIRQPDEERLPKVPNFRLAQEATAE